MFICARAFCLEPYANSTDAKPADEDEQRVWDLGRSLDEDLLRKNKIRPASQLEAYLQSILNKLYPEFEGAMRVRVLMQPEVNAFATAAGNIYLTEGLLARLENEAQLATVLGHEGAHFVYRHAAKTANRQRLGEGATTIAKTLLNSANPFSKISLGNMGDTAIDAAKSVVVDQAKSMADDMLLSSAKEQLEQFKTKIRKAITGSFSGMRPEGFSSTSVFGFNGFMEKEADQIGFERMVNAGYDPDEAIKLFKLLGDEMQRRSKVEFYFFSSISMLSAREASFKEMASKTESRKVNHDDYANHANAIRILNLEQEIATGRYDALLNYFGGELGASRIQQYPAEVRFYLGEAYRIRDAQGDSDLAESQYKQVLANNSGHWGALRSLGLIYSRTGRYADAEHYLRTSLTHTNSEHERGFTQQMLKQLASASSQAK
jgi:predicted Zn-dependent protease